MIGLFDQFEDFDKKSKHHDEIEPHIHREDCPMSIFYGNPHKYSTLCVCKELDAADLKVKREEESDNDEAFGGF